LKQCVLCPRSSALLGSRGSEAILLGTMGRVFPAFALLLLCAILLKLPEWKVAKCFQLPRSTLPPNLAVPVARRQQLARRAEGDGRQEVYGGPEDMFDKSRPLPAEAQMIGEQIVFDVELARPAGLRIVEKDEDDPGSGIGVQEIEPQGAAMELIREVIENPRSRRMWVQDGDELVAIEDVPTEGSKERFMEIVQALGDKPTVKFTFSRKRKGPIMVVFPDGSFGFSPRYAKLIRVAESCGYDHGCTSKTGTDKNCWFRDPSTGEVYVLPLNVPGVVPSLWRAAGEYGLRPGEGEYENWVPLRLERATDAYEVAMEQENLRKGAINKRLAERGLGQIE